MKHLLLMILMLSFQSNVFANNNDKNECSGWARKAEMFMEVRQQSVPIPEAMKQVNGNRSRGMMLRAYQQPVQQNKADKQKAISEFRNEIEQECLQQK